MHVYIIKMSYYIEKYKFKEIFIKDYTLELTLARISKTLAFLHVIS